MWSPLHGNLSESAVWHPELDYRGTFGILSSCLTTMFLCIWMAVHLNIPKYGKGSRQKWHRLGWLILGLLAPEIVAFNAYEQYKTAATSLSRIRKYLNIEEPLSPQQKLAKCVRTFTRGNIVKYSKDQERGNSVFNPENAQFKPFSSFSMHHTFYVLMGGFVIRESKTFPAGPSPRIGLTLDGFELLVRYAPDVLYDIDWDEIMDKNKADGLIKLLTVMQALWFCLQCITRLSQQLSIALLEIHVLGHAVCAFVIYILWWNKPFDIKQATLLKGDKIESIAALLRLLDPDPGSYFRAEQWKPFSSLSETGLKKDRLDVPVEPYEQVFRFTYVGTKAKTLESAEFEQLRAASCALDMVDPQALERHTPYLLPRAHNQVLAFSKNLEMWSYTEHQKSLMTWGSLIVGCAAFGGLHLLSWFAPFHGSVEMQLWRVPATAVTCTGPSLLCLALMANASMAIPEPSPSLLGHDEPRLPHGMNLFFHFLLGKGGLMSLMVLISGLSYLMFLAFARTFLVVECFINLAYIPESALATPEWSRYVPHLS